MTTEPKYALLHKSSLIFLRQFLILALQLCDESVFFSLIVPLSLISNHLPREQNQPKASNQNIVEVELSLVRIDDWRGEPQNEVELVVSGEEEVQQLHKDPMIVLSNVFPSVVLAALGISTLPEEIVSQSKSPQRNQSHHHQLSSIDRDISTPALMVDKVHVVENRNQRPYSINPRILTCGDGEHPSYSAEDSGSNH